MKLKTYRVFFGLVQRDSGSVLVEAPSKKAAKELVGELEYDELYTLTEPETTEVVCHGISEVEGEEPDYRWGEEDEGEEEEQDYPQCRVCETEVASGEGDFTFSPPVHFRCARENGIPTWLDPNPPKKKEA